MTTTLTTRANGTVARPLKTLVPLIKSEIKMGFKAGERHWLAVGRLLVEARTHWTQREPRVNGITFHGWVAENFIHPMTNKPLSEDVADRWMQGARQIDRSPRDRGDLTADAVLDKRSPKHDGYNRETDWKKDVRQAQKDFKQTLNVEAQVEERRDALREEKELRALADKIISAGYRALAAVVHPDKKGGSVIAMQKLTKARDWLKEAISQ